jgi:hypothetical protein
MFLLRIVSFIAGSFVMFAAPFLLLSRAAGEAVGGALSVFIATVAVLVFALGYYFIALTGHRSARSPGIRHAAAGLIAFQLAAGAFLLSVSSNAQALVAAAPLLCLSVLLFMAFVWPGDAGRGHRPMRRRDHSPMH